VRHGYLQTSHAGPFLSSRDVTARHVNSARFRQRSVVAAPGPSDTRVDTHGRSKKPNIGMIMADAWAPGTSALPSRHDGRLHAHIDRIAPRVRCSPLYVQQSCRRASGVHHGPSPFRTGLLKSGCLPQQGIRVGPTFAECSSHLASLAQSQEPLGDRNEYCRRFTASRVLRILYHPSSHGKPYDTSSRRIPLFPQRFGPARNILERQGHDVAIRPSIRLGAGVGKRASPTAVRFPRTPAWTTRPDQP